MKKHDAKRILRAASAAAAAVIAALVILPALFGCGDSGGDGRLKIVATVFPEYDWARQIVGGVGNAEIILLAENGADIHNFQPSAEDIIKIGTADIMIYVGGESDKWVDDALKTAMNKKLVALNLLDILGDAAKEEEAVEGMETEEDGGEEDGPEYDEHVWLSLRNAALFCEHIADAVCAADPGNADAYRANADAYIARLKALDGRYAEAVGNAEVRTLVFGDRFPFRYLVDDYGLDYYAAFVGCSAETEASFKTIVFLTEKVNELKLGAILSIETSDGSIARTIRGSTKTKDQRLLVLDSLQSKTIGDAEKGVTYLSVMESNLEVLRDALKR